MAETTQRSLAKTISWRISGSSATFLISYIILDDISISGSIALIQLVFNTLLYYIHERVWNLVRWGQNGK